MKTKSMASTWVGLGMIAGLLALGAGTGLAEQVKLVAHAQSDRYHVSSCKVARKMPVEEQIVYAKPEDALTDGKVPCKKCDPPKSSK